MTFYGKEKMDEHVKHHIHESPAVMIKPLQVLAFLSIVGGYIGLPAVLGGGNWFAKFLTPVIGHHDLHISHGTEILLMVVSVSVGLLGIFTAYVFYIKKEGAPAEWLSVKFKTAYKIIYNKYFIDEFYNGVIVAGVMKLGTALGKFDLSVIDGIVNGVASLTKKISSGSMSFDSTIVDGLVNGVANVNQMFSRVLRKLQTGYIYNYALAVVMGLFIIITLILIL